MLFLLFFLGVTNFCSAGLTSFQYSNVKKLEPMVIGGVNAQRHQFPHIVSLQHHGKHICAGSIISSTWVVTAGHCCNEKYPELTCSKFYAVAGLLHQGEHHSDVQNVSVSNAVHHPEFSLIDGKELKNDIALLKLSSALKFTDAVKPINLLSDGQTFEEGWVAGWGVYMRPSLFPVTLQCMKLQIINNTVCQEYLSHFDKSMVPFPLIDTMVCTLPPTGPESGCHGDSGGALLHNDTLIGIVSWGVLCEYYNVGSPNVFTAVSQYNDFIDMNVDDLP